MATKPKIAFVCIIFIGISLCIGIGYYWFYRCELRQNLANLIGTLEAGAEIQQVADDYKERIGHYPACDTLASVLDCIGPHNECTSPNITNKIVSVRDNCGGWFYNETNGEVRINFDGHYPIGFRSWVDVSKVKFYPPMKVDAICYGKPETLDYSSLSNWLDSKQPEIQKIITNWSATNVVKTGSKNITGLDALVQN